MSRVDRQTWAQRGIAHVQSRAICQSARRIMSVLAVRVRGGNSTGALHAICLVGSL
jgi:hypothetical protein